MGTWVWALTVVPAGVKPYYRRGWPRFEKAISTLIKDSYMFLDLGAIEDKDFEDFDCQDEDVTKFDKMRAICQGVRDPPMLPETFRETLESLTFTNGADRNFVLQKYFNTFTELMGSTSRLDFTDMPWGDSEMAAVAEVLPWCPSVKVLRFTGCVYITFLPEELGEMKACTLLDLSFCTSLESLPEGIGNMQACTEIDLTGCTSLASLPEGIDNMQELRTLYLDETDKLDKQAAPLARLRERGCEITE